MTGGVTAAVRPSTLAEAQELMRQGTRVVITGAGTGSGWGGPPADVDVTLDTTGLDRVRSYQPTDLTVAVEAGTPLRDLQTMLAGNGQRVALDAARVADGATVGGLLATADAGPSRLAFGSLRDLVIGITVVLADGVVARSGGHVIKNVAGYDLAKLFSGSLGTLGLIAEVVLRLHPLPLATGTLAVDCDPAGAATLASRLLARSLEPTALEWYAGTLLARFEGTPGGLEARGKTARDVAREVAGASAQWLPAERLPAEGLPAEGLPEAEGRWRRLAEVALGSPGDTVLQLRTRPADWPWLAHQVEKLAGAGVTVDLSSSLAVGVHTLRIQGPAVELVDALRREVGARGGSTTICRWGEGLAGQLPAWGDPPPALPVLRAVKDAFDPDGRLGPGRFTPWL